MRGFLISLFVFLLMVNTALGANIHGSIYDLSLNKMGNVVVEINTAPKQFYVSKNGTYSFIVPIGSYKVKAQHYESSLLVSSTSENITVKNAGDYILDLVLFPIINEEELLEDELKVQKGNLYRNNFIVFLVIILVVSSILFYFYNKKKAVKKDKLKKVVEEEKKVAESDFYGEGILDKVIEIIKEEGGRTTQKDIRKKIPLSEAKISLVIAELEANDKIRKIRKGRGNIIILK